MTATLTINSFDLARRKARIEGQFALASLPRVAPALAADGTLAHSPLMYSIDGWTDADGHPGGTLNLKARLPLICQRCGEPMDWDLDRSARFRFVREERDLEQIPLDDDDLDAVVGADAMDAVAWIEDEVLLSMPLLPRHAECRPMVLNGAADVDSGRPNPFAALAALKQRPG
jgi:uncharacterized protein